MSGPRKALQGLTAPLKERLIQESLDELKAVTAGK